jgi:ribose transport system substrate-binding protein
LPCLTLAISGCGFSAATDTAAPVKGTIGIAVLTLANPFFKQLADAVAAESESRGYNAVIVSSDTDPAKQRSQVQDFLVRGVSAIVLTPCESRAVGTAIRDANAAGIPVFTADIACLAPDARVVAHVATDNEGGGRLAAQAMIEALDGRGKVAILDYPEIESVILRTRGFRDELKLRDTGIEVVACLPGGAEREKSMKVMQDILQSHPDLSGVFAINDPSALGAVAALERAGRLADVTVIGFDGQPDGLAAIRAGKIHADPVQFPDRIGRQVATAACEYLDGLDVEPEQLIPTALVTRYDLATTPPAD